VKRYSLSHLPDAVLLRELSTLVARDRAVTAALLAHIAEVDARKLYLPASYPSMFKYCTLELKLSEDAAFSRIRAARTARQYPEIFEAVADGRLNLVVVLLLAPHLTAVNADELLAESAHKTKADVELLIARRFPRPDVPALIRPLTSPCLSPQLAPGPVEARPQPAPAQVPEAAPATLDRATANRQLVPERVEARPKVTPLAPERFALQLTIGQSTHDKLRRAQELLGHSVPSGDLAQVIDRALDALITKLEKRKFAASTRPRSSRRPATSTRCIPAQVRRAVRKRDGDQCTFVSAEGERCPARTMLEFDHWKERSRGGAATIENIRLRCRGHNQYAAERTYGKEFMREKRREAVEAQAKRRAEDSARARCTEALPRVNGRTTSAFNVASSS
jgi:5-methylcytosine-specific restriction endonuclease McrA